MPVTIKSVNRENHGLCIHLNPSYLNKITLTMSHTVYSIFQASPTDTVLAKEQEKKLLQISMRHSGKWQVRYTMTHTAHLLGIYLCGFCWAGMPWSAFQRCVFVSFRVEERKKQSRMTKRPLVINVANNSYFIQKRPSLSHCSRTSGHTGFALSLTSDLW